MNESLKRIKAICAIWLVLSPLLAPRTLVSEESNQNSQHIKAPASDLVGALPGSSVDRAIDLGRLDGKRYISGQLNSALSDVFYKVTIGCGDCIEWERTRFEAPRALTVVAKSDSNQALGLELRGDLGELLQDSASLNQNSRIIKVPNQRSEVFYIRVFTKAPRATDRNTDFSISIEIAPLPIHTDKAGKDPATARNLGPILKEISLRDFIGEKDAVDFYAFQLNAESDLYIAIEGLKEVDIALSVLKGSLSTKEGEGDIIRYSDFDGDMSEEIFLKDLERGKYLIKVSQVSGNGEYSLSLKLSAPLNLTPAGKTFEHALDVGPLDTEKSFRGYLDGKNREGFYRFQIDDARQVWISRRTFGELTAKMEVLKQRPCRTAQGCKEGIANSSGWAIEDGMTEFQHFNSMAFGTGEYFIRLRRESGEAPYELKIRSEPAPADSAGDTEESAKHLSVRSQGYTFSESVGKLDPVDLFRFTISDVQRPIFKVCSLGEKATLQVFRSSIGGKALVREVGCKEPPRYGRCCQEIKLDQLSPGDYFLEIEQTEGAAEYTFSVKTPDLVHSKNQ